MKDLVFPEEYKYILNFYDKFYPIYDVRYCGKSNVPYIFQGNSEKIKSRLPFKRDDFDNDFELLNSIQKMNLDANSIFEFICFLFIHILFTDYVAIKNIIISKNALTKKFRKTKIGQLEEEIKNIEDRSLKDEINDFFKFKDIYNGNPIQMKRSKDISLLRQEYIFTTTYTSRIKQFMLIQNLEDGIPEFIKAKNVQYTTIEREFYLRILNFVGFINYSPDRSDLIIDFAGTFNSLKRDFDEIECSLCTVNANEFFEFLNFDLYFSNLWVDFSEKITLFSPHFLR